MNHLTMRILTTFSALLLLCVGLTAQESVALRVGTLITNDGKVLEDATVLVENGRITQVGNDIDLPFDVLLREFPDATLFPGFCEAHTSSGTDRANENVPIAPFLDVKDSIDPVAFFYEDELRGGTVAIGVIPGNNCVIGGRGRVVAPHGMTVEAMTVSAQMGMKVAFGPKRRWSRAAQLAELRDAVATLELKLEQKGQALLDGGARDEELRAAGDEIKDKSDDGDGVDNRPGFVTFGEDYPGKALISEEDVSETDRDMVKLLNGDYRLWVYAPTATDIDHAISWLAKWELTDQTVFVVTAPAWRGAEMLQETGRPVVLSGSLWDINIDPVTLEEERIFAPVKLLEAGVAVAIGSNKSRLGPDRLSYQAATCIREGMSRSEAMAAVTTAAARAWGLEQQVGKIAPGFDGSFVLLNGDPLAQTSKVLGVWVRGSRVYDRATDERLQRLLEGGLK